MRIEIATSQILTHSFNPKYLIIPRKPFLKLRVINKPSPGAGSVLGKGIALNGSEVDGR